MNRILFLILSLCVMPSFVMANPAIVKADFLNVREAPSIESTRIARLPNLMIIEAGEEVDEWCPVSWTRRNAKTGVETPMKGYVKAEFLIPMTHNGLTAQFLNTNWVLYPQDGDRGGTLIINSTPEGVVSTWYRLVDRVLQRAELPATIEVNETYWGLDGNVYRPKTETAVPLSFACNPEAGLAVFAGQIWTEIHPSE